MKKPERIVKKCISLSLVLLMLLSSIVPDGFAYASESPSSTSEAQLGVFKDISGHWAESSILSALESGFVNGYEDGTYKPNQPVTRAEFVTMINNALELRESNIVKLLFTDVHRSDWFYNEIQKASYAKYVNGISETSFKPNANITRQEAATMLAKILPKAGFESDTALAEFADVTSISDWAKSSLAVIVNKGYLKGFANGSLQPLGTLTRAEAAAMIGRILTGEQIVREDVFVSKEGDILEDKIYVGDIIIEKIIGEGEAALSNISALSKVYVFGGGVNTITINNSLIIQLIVSKEGTKVRVLSSGNTVIYESIVFNEGLTVDSEGKNAKPGEAGYKNIVYVEGTIESEDAIKIAEELTKQADSNGILTKEMTTDAIQSLFPGAKSKTNADGSITVRIEETPAPVSSGSSHTVKKVMPVIVTYPSPTDITYGETFAESTLVGGVAEYKNETVAGTFEFVDDTIQPDTFGNYSAEIRFTPDDGTNFNTIDNTVNGATVLDVTVLVNKREITVTAGSDSKVYDGIALTSSEYSITSGSLVADQEIIVTTEGTQLVVGNSANTASDAVISSGTTDVTSNYNISYEEGALTVTTRPITFTADSETKTYDGTVLNDSGYTITSGSLASGQTAALTVIGSQTNVGNNANTASDAVISSGTTDVTSNYSISYEEGALTVTTRPITFTADSETKIYDGTVLNDNGYTVTSGSLASGQTVSVTVTGSQTTAGNSLNTASDAVISAGETDVTSNYSISYETGTLTVLHKPITIIGASNEKVYDGTSLSNHNSELSDGTPLVSGDILVGVTTTGYQATVGSSNNTPSDAVIISGIDGPNVTTNYAITYTPGTLSITKREITVSANSDSVTYNGLEQSVSGWTLMDGTLVDSHTISANVGASGTNAGTYTASGIITIMSGSTDVTENYNITNISGTLVINKLEIDIIANSATKTYDATVLTDHTSELDAETPLATGHVLEAVTTSGYQLNAGSSDNTPSDASIMQGDVNVIDNYLINYIAGTLTVNEKAVTVTPNNQSIDYGNIYNFTGNEFTRTQMVGSDSIATVALSSTGNTGSAADNTYPIIASNAVGLEGTNLNNYDITYETGTLTVIGAAIGSNGDILEDKEYYEPGLEGRTITSFTLTVEGQPGHSSGGDTATAYGYNINTETWDVLAASPGDGSGGGINWSYDIADNTYSQLKFYYYAAHCLYGVSHINWTVTYDPII